jgi:trans-aconitate methyltransferase
MRFELDFSVELDQRSGLAQADERLTVIFADGRREHMRLHEYGRVYTVPGLYEEVVQRRLECASPAVLSRALVKHVVQCGDDPAALRLLDIGAGNGVVGEELRKLGVDGAFFGMDKEGGAREAAERDRPGLYVEYLIGDLAELSIASMVEKYSLTGMVGAGVFGPGHVSAANLNAAWQQFRPGAWLAVTLPENVVNADGEELSDYVAALRAGEENTEVTEFSRYRHRFRMSGDPIYYYLMVARRTRDAGRTVGATSPPLA